MREFIRTCIILIIRGKIRKITNSYKLFLLVTDRIQQLPGRAVYMRSVKGLTWHQITKLKKRSQ